MIETPNQNPFEKITQGSFNFETDILNKEVSATIIKPHISESKPEEWNSYFVEVYNFGEVLSHIKQKNQHITLLSSFQGEIPGLRFLPQSIPDKSEISPEHIYFYPPGSMKLAEVHSDYHNLCVATMQTQWLMKPFIIIPIHAIIDHE